MSVRFNRTGFLFIKIFILMIDVSGAPLKHGPEEGPPSPLGPDKAVSDPHPPTALERTSTPRMWDLPSPDGTFLGAVEQVQWDAGGRGPAVGGAHGEGRAVSTSRQV